MTAEIAEGLKPLFKKARKENLMFHCNYQDLIYSADELEEHQKHGRFCWGARNWDLVSAESRYNELLKKAESVANFAENFRKKYVK